MKTCDRCALWDKQPGSTFGNFTGKCERAATVVVSFQGDCISQAQPYDLKGDNLWNCERIAKPMVNVNVVITYGKFGCIHWKMNPAMRWWRRLFTKSKPTP